jgi:MFS family permease
MSAVAATTHRPFSRQIPTWAPLRTPLFRALWLAALASNIGTWMHDVGAAWLMTSLSKDPALNALVAGAGALPMFLLALPAGALADILDRRKLLIATQCWALLVTGTLATLTYFNLASPIILLIFTALLALGSALSQPAWQSVTPEIVKKQELAAAIGLGGISWNIARIVGPMIGGFIIGILAPRVGDTAAPAAVFALNAISFSGVALVIYKWKREPRHSDLPPEHVIGAVKTGLRYARHSPELRAILVRNFGYILFGSALWALLPLHANTNLKLDATGYGTLIGFFGTGAVIMGAMFERLRARFSPDQLVAISSIGAAIHFVGLATFDNVWLVRLIQIGGGFAWPLAMLTFQVAMLKTAPEWIRSRAASLLLLVFTGGMTLGSAIWGTLGQLTSLQYAFYVAAAGLLGSLLVLRRFRVSENTTKTAPSQHWPDPVLEFEPEPEAGPVLVTTEFCIPPDDARAFVDAMQRVRQIRLREGALRWNLFQDAAEPTRWMETMLVEVGKTICASTRAFRWKPRNLRRAPGTFIRATARRTFPISSRRTRYASMKAIETRRDLKLPLLKHKGRGSQSS